MPPGKQNPSASAQEIAEKAMHEINSMSGTWGGGRVDSRQYAQTETTRIIFAAITAAVAQVDKPGINDALLSERVGDLTKALQHDGNHDSEAHDGEPIDEHDCFCVRCCAIRLSAAVVAAEQEKKQDLGLPEPSSETTHVRQNWLTLLSNKANENIKKWGLQDFETLGLAICEEAGETARAVLKYNSEGGKRSAISSEALDLGALCLQVFACELALAAPSASSSVLPAT